MIELTWIKTHESNSCVFLVKHFFTTFKNATLLTDIQSRLSVMLNNCTIGWWGIRGPYKENYLSGEEIQQTQWPKLWPIILDNWIWVWSSYRPVVISIAVCRSTSRKLNSYSVKWWWQEETLLECCEDYMKQPKKNIYPGQCLIYSSSPESIKSVNHH